MPRTNHEDTVCCKPAVPRFTRHRRRRKRPHSLASADSTTRLKRKPPVPIFERGLIDKENSTCATSQLTFPPEPRDARRMSLRSFMERKQRKRKEMAEEERRRTENQHNMRRERLNELHEFTRAQKGRSRSKQRVEHQVSGLSISSSLTPGILSSDRAAHDSRSTLPPRNALDMIATVMTKRNINISANSLQQRNAHPQSHSSRIISTVGPLRRSIGAENNDEDRNALNREAFLGQIGDHESSSLNNTDMATVDTGGPSSGSTIRAAAQLVAEAMVEQAQMRLDAERVAEEAAVLQRARESARNNRVSRLRETATDLTSKIENLQASIQQHEKNYRITGTQNVDFVGLEAKPRKKTTEFFEATNDPIPGVDKISLALGNAELEVSHFKEGTTETVRENYRLCENEVRKENAVDHGKYPGLTDSNDSEIASVYSEEFEAPNPDMTIVHENLSQTRHILKSQSSVPLQIESKDIVDKRAAAVFWDCQEHDAARNVSCRGKGETLDAYAGVSTVIGRAQVVSFGGSQSMVQLFALKALANKQVEEEQQNPKMILTSDVCNPAILAKPSFALASNDKNRMQELSASEAEYEEDDFEDDFEPESDENEDADANADAQLPVPQGLSATSDKSYPQHQQLHEPVSEDVAFPLAAESIIETPQGPAGDYTSSPKPKLQNTLSSGETLFFDQRREHVSRDSPKVTLPMSQEDATSAMPRLGTRSAPYSSYTHPLQNKKNIGTFTADEKNHLVGLAPSALRRQVLAQVALLETLNQTSGHLSEIQHTHALSVANQETVELAQRWEAQQRAACEVAHAVAFQQSELERMARTVNDMRSDLEAQANAKVLKAHKDSERIRAELSEATKRESGVQTQTAFLIDKGSDPVEKSETRDMGTMATEVMDDNFTDKATPFPCIVSTREVPHSQIINHSSKANELGQEEYHLSAASCESGSIEYSDDFNESDDVDDQNEAELLTENSGDLTLNVEVANNNITSETSVAVSIEEESVLITRESQQSLKQAADSRESAFRTEISHSIDANVLSVDHESPHLVRSLASSPVEKSNVSTVSIPLGVSVSDDIDEVAENQSLPEDIVVSHSSTVDESCTVDESFDAYSEEFEDESEGVPQAELITSKRTDTSSSEHRVRTIGNLAGEQVINGLSNENEATLGSFQKFSSEWIRKNSNNVDVRRQHELSLLRMRSRALEERTQAKLELISKYQSDVNRKETDAQIHDNSEQSMNVDRDKRDEIARQRIMLVYHACKAKIEGERAVINERFFKEELSLLQHTRAVSRLRKDTEKLRRKLESLESTVGGASSPDKSSASSTDESYKEDLDFYPKSIEEELGHFLLHQMRKKTQANRGSNDCEAPELDASPPQPSTGNSGVGFNERVVKPGEVNDIDVPPEIGQIKITSVGEIDTVAELLPQPLPQEEISAENDASNSVSLPPEASASFQSHSEVLGNVFDISELLTRESDKSVVKEHSGIMSPACVSEEPSLDAQGSVADEIEDDESEDRYEDTFEDEEVVVLSAMEDEFKSDQNLSDKPTKSIVTHGEVPLPVSQDVELNAGKLGCGVSGADMGEVSRATEDDRLEQSLDLRNAKIVILTEELERKQRDLSKLRRTKLLAEQREQQREVEAKLASDLRQVEIEIAETQELLSKSRDSRQTRTQTQETSPKYGRQPIVRKMLSPVQRVGVSVAIEEGENENEDEYDEHDDPSENNASKFCNADEKGVSESDIYEDTFAEETFSAGPQDEHARSKESETVVDALHVAESWSSQVMVDEEFGDSAVLEVSGLPKGVEQKTGSADTVALVAVADLAESDSFASEVHSLVNDCIEEETALDVASDSFASDAESHSEIPTQTSIVSRDMRMGSNISEGESMALDQSLSVATELGAFVGEQHKLAEVNSPAAAGEQDTRHLSTSPHALSDSKSLSEIDKTTDTAPNAVEQLPNERDNSMQCVDNTGTVRGYGNVSRADIANRLTDILMPEILKIAISDAVGKWITRENVQRRETVVTHEASVAEGVLNDDIDEECSPMSVKNKRGECKSGKINGISENNATLISDDMFSEILQETLLEAEHIQLIRMTRHASPSDVDADVVRNATAIRSPDNAISKHTQSHDVYDFDDVDVVPLSIRPKINTSSSLSSAASPPMLPPAITSGVGGIEEEHEHLESESFFDWKRLVIDYVAELLGHVKAKDGLKTAPRELDPDAESLESDQIVAPISVDFYLELEHMRNRPEYRQIHNKLLFDAVNETLAGLLPAHWGRGTASSWMRAPFNESVKLQRRMPSLGELVQKVLHRVRRWDSLESGPALPEIDREDHDVPQELWTMSAQERMDHVLRIEMREMEPARVV